MVVSQEEDNLNLFAMSLKKKLQQVGQSGVCLVLRSQFK